jgi:hypothetical protein
MSEYSELRTPGTGGTTTGPSTTDVVRDEAAGVGQHARDAGGQVTQTATDQAKQVAAEAGAQARDLLGEARGQARDQASAQQQKAAQQLHTVADELGQLAENGGQSGVATEAARQASSRLHGAAAWLEKREPADLLNEVRSFARRRPGTFLIGAAVAGLAAGRLTRGLAAKGHDQQGAGDSRLPAGSGYQGQPAYQDQPAYAAEPAYPDTTAAPGYPVSQGYPAEPGYAAEQAYPTEVEPADETTPPFPATYPDDAETHPDLGGMPRANEPRYQ